MKGNARDHLRISVLIDEVRAVTDRGALCDVDMESVWIPFSVVDEPCDIDDLGTRGYIAVEKWFADRKGFEYES